MQMLFLILTVFAVACLECRHEVMAFVAALSALAVMLVAISGVSVLAHP